MDRQFYRQFKLHTHTPYTLQQTYLNRVLTVQGHVFDSTLLSCVTDNKNGFVRIFAHVFLCDFMLAHFYNSV